MHQSASGNHKTVYFHIGLHKTGTTSIQASMTTLRNRLLSEGIYIPITGRNMHAHHNLAFGLWDYHPQYIKSAGTIEDLYREILATDIEKFLLSSEVLCLLREDSLARIHSQFAHSPLDIKIILYLRNPYDWLASAWSERTKGYASLTLNDSIAETKLASQYVSAIDRWGNQFGRQNLILQSYDTVIQQKNGLLRSFWQAVGIQHVTEDFLVDSVRNVAPSYTIVEFWRKVKSRISQEIMVEDNIENTIILSRLLNTYADTHPLPRVDFKVFFTQASYDIINQHYIPYTRRIAREFFGCDELYTERSYPGYVAEEPVIPSEWIEGLFDHISQHYHMTSIPRAALHNEELAIKLLAGIGERIIRGTQKPIRPQPTGSTAKQLPVDPFAPDYRARLATYQRTLGK